MSWDALNLVSIYPIRMHWSTLSEKRTNFYTYLATAQKSKYAVVLIHTEEEFHLFNYSVSLNGNWFHQMVPLILKLAAWWSAKADGKKICHKMHEHLESHYKKWTHKKQEKENLVNSLSKRKNQERIQVPTYIAQVLDPFQFFDNGLTNNEELPPARKNPGSKIHLFCQLLQVHNPN